MEETKHAKRQWKPPEEVEGDNKEEPTRGRRFGFQSDLLENSWHSDKERGRAGAGKRSERSAGTHRGTSRVQLQAAFHEERREQHECMKQNIGALEKDLNLQDGCGEEFQLPSKLK